jgi:hypothetical protein
MMPHKASHARVVATSHGRGVELVLTPTAEKTGSDGAEPLAGKGVHSGT